MKGRNISSRLISFTLAVLLIVTSASIPIEASKEQIKVLVDGTEVVFTDAHPIIVDGRTLVPIRGVFEHMGYIVDWNPDTATASLSKEDITILIQEGAGDFSVNGQSITPDVPPQIREGRFYLPLRAIGESIGAEFGWDPDTRTINLYTSGNSGQTPGKDGDGNKEEENELSNPEIFDIIPMYEEVFLSTKLFQLKIKTNEDEEHIELKFGSDTYTMNRNNAIANYFTVYNDGTTDWIFRLEPVSIGTFKTEITAFGNDTASVSESIHITVADKKYNGNTTVYDIMPANQFEVEPGRLPNFYVVTDLEAVNVHIDLDGQSFYPYTYFDKIMDGTAYRYWPFSHVEATTTGAHRAKVEAIDLYGYAGNTVYFDVIVKEKHVEAEAPIPEIIEISTLHDEIFTSVKLFELQVKTSANVEQVHIAYAGDIYEMDRNFFRKEMIVDNGDGTTDWIFRIEGPSTPGEYEIQLTAFGQSGVSVKEIINTTVINKAQHYNGNTVIYDNAF